MSGSTWSTGAGEEFYRVVAPALREEMIEEKKDAEKTKDSLNFENFTKSAPSVQIGVNDWGSRLGLIFDWGSFYFCLIL